MKEENDIVISTNVYLNPKIKSLKDRVITTEHYSQNAFIVDGLLFALEFYVVNTKTPIRDFEDDLIEALEKEDYKRYYKIIKKIVKQCNKSFD